MRQIPVPEELRWEVEKGIHRFAEIQQWLKQIAQINQELSPETCVWWSRDWVW